MASAVTSSLPSALWSEAYLLVMKTIRLPSTLETFRKIRKSRTGPTRVMGEHRRKNAYRRRPKHPKSDPE